MSGNEYTVDAFIEYVKKARSKNTLIMYNQGLSKFSEWYGKDLNAILAERRADWKSDDMFTKKRFAQKVEEFHADLIKRGHTRSTAATLTQGIKSIFSYYEMPLPVSRETSKQAATTQDFVPSVNQYQAMYKACDNLRDRLIIQMGLNLAWRIGDFASIKKAELPNLEEEAPIAFERMTEKENVLAKSFLSAETVALLREYLATTKNDTNPYLFASNSVGHLDASSINRMLQKLAEKVALPIPNEKRLRFHCFRKRFLSECANLRVDVNTAKTLTGKTVERSMGMYVSEVNYREEFIRVSEHIRLTEKVQAMPKQSESELAKRVAALERRQAIYAELSPELVAKVDDMLKALNLTMKADATILERIDAIVQAKENAQRREYERLIAENNNGE